jgi:asparagine synthase (glutamine-hydrolysing)
MQARLLSPRFYREVGGAPLRNLHQVLRQLPPLPSALKAQLYFLRQYGPRSVVHGPVLTRSRVETCFPFADAELLDSTCRVPAERRRQRQLEIEMLKLASPELAGVPWQFSGLPAAASSPRRVRLQRGLYRLQRELNARTRGAWPAPSGREQVEWAQWFRTSLRPWLETILLDERTLARGYFNPQGIRDLIGEHVRGARDHTNQFGVLLTFELWQRLFIDGDGLCEPRPIPESGT